jgi:hypothetical protein
MPLCPPARDVPTYSFTRVPAFSASTLFPRVHPARANTDGFVSSSDTQCSTMPSFVMRSNIIVGCGFW